MYILIFAPRSLIINLIINSHNYMMHECFTKILLMKSTYKREYNGKGQEENIKA
jgi:hypothetical protein